MDNGWLTYRNLGITGAIVLKISAITMLYTSKIHVIALKKFFSVITYFKKVIHPKSTKMTKMCDKKIGVDQFGSMAFNFSNLSKSKQETILKY